MSDYQSQHRRSGRPMDYTDSGSGTGLWIVLGLLAVIALIGVIMAGAGGGAIDGTTAPAAGESNAIEPATGETATGDLAPAAGTGAPN